jgi:hypothetical protein
VQDFLAGPGAALEPAGKPKEHKLLEKGDE